MEQQPSSIERSVCLYCEHMREVHILLNILACACDQSHNQKVHKHVFSTLVDPNKDIGFELVFLGVKVEKS